MDLLYIVGLTLLWLGSILLAEEARPYISRSRFIVSILLITGGQIVIIIGVILDK